MFSSSSDYDDWSLQFLRVVRILCALDEVPVSPQEQQHRSTSPRRRRWNSFLGSINRDSVPPASPPTGEGQLPSQQQHSIEDLSLAFESLRKESPKPGDISSSPFFLLEEVWSSLYSWYDLLDQEVQRLPESTDKTVEQSSEVAEEQYDGVIPELMVQTSVGTVATASLGNDCVLVCTNDHHLMLIKVSMCSLCFVSCSSALMYSHNDITIVID